MNAAASATFEPSGGSIKDRIIRSIWALGESATLANLKKAVDCSSSLLLDMQIEAMHKRGEIYITAGGHYALQGALADSMLEQYPEKPEPAPPDPPPAAKIDTAPTTPSTPEPAVDKKTCCTCKKSKPKDQFDKWQRECKECGAGVGDRAPTSKVAKPATKKKSAAPKKRAAAAPIAEAPVVDEYVIHASGAIKCKAQGTNGGRQYLLEQDGALIIVDRSQLLELVGWSTLQLKADAS